MDNTQTIYVDKSGNNFPIFLEIRKLPTFMLGALIFIPRVQSFNIYFTHQHPCTSYFYGGPNLQITIIFYKLQLFSTNHYFFLQYGDFFLQITTFSSSNHNFFLQSTTFFSNTATFFIKPQLFSQCCNLFLQITTFFIKPQLFSTRHNFFFPILQLFSSNHIFFLESTTFFSILQLVSTKHNFFLQYGDFSLRITTLFFKS